LYVHTVARLSVLQIELGGNCKTCMDYALSGLGYCIVLVGLSPYAIDGRAFSPEMRTNKG